jgi:hypothetical protein
VDWDLPFFVAQALLPVCFRGWKSTAKSGCATVVLRSLDENERRERKAKKEADPSPVRALRVWAQDDNEKQSTEFPRTCLI